MTHKYELMVILDPEIDERTVAPSLDKFLNVIRKDGGSVDNVDIWGRRRLAYEINKKTEGIYAVVKLTATADSTKELDRQLKLSEAVMRTKVLRAEEAIAQVAEAAKLAEAKAARAAANPKTPSSAPSASAPSASSSSAPAGKSAAPAAAPAARAAAAVKAASSKPAADAAPAAAPAAAATAE
ncbi:30S ribosomal protein S6 [Subtercola boreus]|uniref:Small ribosomal subunit protein bS6 n=1 Tax=Subtercola boreus TaxID=120213 RepID=A0A3E0VM79_9MICO|nr:30S ribosomal protein S6 [Subtercola boreus]RFA10996.1 30S ribosomal protein S6 [Subtercola boreus]TQL55405.1 small subunit ribosomal protein S6 [Subtercola boreus]